MAAAQPIASKPPGRRNYGGLNLRLALAADELLHATVGFIVGHLHRRMVGKISGGGVKTAAYAAVEPELATADGIDRDPGGIGRIFDREFEVQLHRHIAEEPAFHADKGDLVVALPRHIIARANMYVFVRQ